MAIQFWDEHPGILTANKNRLALITDIPQLWVSALARLAVYRYSRLDHGQQR